MHVDSFIQAIALPLSGGFLLSFLLELLLRTKRMVSWKRPPAAVCIHLGLWCFLFGLELALFSRPYVAAANVLALILFVVLVNNAKYLSLREPFVAQDFDFFIDTLRHPRMYLPFLGIGRAVVSCAAIVGALYAGLTLEAPLIRSLPPAACVAGTISLCVFGGFLVWMSSKCHLPLTFEPEVDLERLGLLASLWCYGAEERKPIRVAGAKTFAAPAVRLTGSLPDLVVVQSESFFDARRLFPGIRPEVLRRFDRLKEAAVCHGLLEVPAWGANTVRTEFSFLTGLGNEALGVHRFNPYRRMARQGVPNLAGFLKRFGYRTVCVHPYPASFYARDKVFPVLGFDEFIDIRSMGEIPKTGQYVGDVELAEIVGGLLDARSSVGRQPLFLFVITMENHGPLHFESPVPEEVERYYSEPPPAGCNDLTVYLRHLANADRMFGMLREQMERQGGEGWLCLYGDHPPIMPHVYDALGVPGNRTDYVIWNKKQEGGPAAFTNMKVEDLGVLLMQKMGLSPTSSSRKRMPSRMVDNSRREDRSSQVGKDLR